MPFTPQMMALLLIAAFIGISVLARLIAKQIEKVTSKRMGAITYLAVGILSFYYVLDMIFSDGFVFKNIFFYFWLLLACSNFIIFGCSWQQRLKTLGKKTIKTED